MPKAFPREFRDDVVRVARDRGPNVTLAQIATDDGWLRLPALTIEDLAWLIGVLEDWLLHASDDAYDDLAHFAGRGPFTRPADQHARLIAHQLGDHHVTLLRALRAAGIDT